MYRIVQCDWHFYPICLSPPLCPLSWWEKCDEKNLERNVVVVSFFKMPDCLLWSIYIVFFLSTAYILFKRMDFVDLNGVWLLQAISWHFLIREVFVSWNYTCNFCYVYHFVKSVFKFHLLFVSLGYISFLLLRLRYWEEMVIGSLLIMERQLLVVIKGGF